MVDPLVPAWFALIVAAFAFGAGVVTAVIVLRGEDGPSGDNPTH